MLEIVDISQARAWIVDSNRQPASFLKLDISLLCSDLASANLASSVFLGCTMMPETAGQAVAQGAALLTPPSGLSFDQFATRIYGVADIYLGFDPAAPGSWTRSFDHTAYLL